MSCCCFWLRVPFWRPRVQLVAIASSVLGPDSFWVVFVPLGCYTTLAMPANPVAGNNYLLLPFVLVAPAPLKSSCFSSAVCHSMCPQCLSYRVTTTYYLLLPFVLVALALLTASGFASAVCPWIRPQCLRYRATTTYYLLLPFVLVALALLK